MMAQLSVSIQTQFKQMPPDFKKPLFHPNVYLDGGVCLSIINPEGSTHAYGKGGTWTPALTIKQVMMALQIFLDDDVGIGGRALPGSQRLWLVARAG